MKNKNQWQPWIDLKWNRILFDEMPTQYRLLTALALSVANWHPLRGEMQGWGSCGLCVYLNPKLLRRACADCILAKNDQNCFQPGSYWKQWNNAIDTSSRKEKLYANKLYKLLLKFYGEEYRRVS